MTRFESIMAAYCKIIFWVFAFALAPLIAPVAVLTFMCYMAVRLAKELCDSAFREKNEAEVAREIRQKMVEMFQGMPEEMEN